MNICCSCGKELTDFEREFYSIDSEYRCQECFMWFEFITSITWTFEKGKWQRSKGDEKDFEPIVFPEGYNEKEFWRILDQARKNILVREGRQCQNTISR